MRIRNWEKFQHYKKRNPPWIKLHWEILASKDWVMLADDSKLLAIVCMLLASKNDGHVSDDPDYVRRVAYLNHEPDFNALIECGFLIKEDSDASKCKQVQASACPETEAETEKESKSKHQCSTLDIKDKDKGNFSCRSADTNSRLADLAERTKIPKMEELKIPYELSMPIDRRKSRVASKGSLVWQAYSQAYQKRYEISPKRNAKQNSLCARLVDRLGMDDAIGVAAYYPSVRNAFDVARGHALEVLLKDCEKHCTAWKTGRQITQSGAREEDRLKKTGDDWQEILEEFGDGSSKQPAIVGKSTVEGRTQRK